MSDQEPSSQDSVGTQEIYSQDSFNEIWNSLGRTFSNPENIIQGVLTDHLPFIVEYKSNEEAGDNLEVTYEQRVVKGSQVSQLISPSLSQPACDLLEPSLINGTPNVNLYEPIEIPEILPNSAFSGRYNFGIEFEPNSEPITKATPWVYVAERQKLFVKMQCVCPILFNITGDPPPGIGVRGILVYKKPEHCKDIVVRCPNHKNTSKDDHPYQDHVMRCENSSTIYETCPKTKRLSLFIPLSAVTPVAKGCFKGLFKFTCFNSCVGGMNRRPTYLLFRLECGGNLLGHAVVDIRICASPGRDSTDKDLSINQKNGKNTERRNEPSSTTDVTPMAHLTLPSTHSPGSSPTSAYPPRASVLMSASKDPSSAPEPFQFPPAQIPPVQTPQKKRQFPFGTEGYVYKRVMKTYQDSAEDEIFTIEVRGKSRYEMLMKINEGLHLLDGIKPPEPRSTRYATNGVNSPEFTKIQPKLQNVEIKKELPDSTQCDVSPQSSQEVNELSQLSRTSSNASSQSSTTQNLPEYTALKMTMKRTISLTKSPVHKTILMQDASPQNMEVRNVSQV